MNLLDLLRQANDGGAVDQLGRSFDLSPDQTNAALEQIVPELARGIEKNTLSRGGLADLVEALGSGHHQRSVDDPDALADPAVREDGNAILGHILGSKTSSRFLAQRAARETGLSDDLIKQMLPYVASMTMGSLSKAFAGSLNNISSNIKGNPAGLRAMPEGGFQLPDYRMPDGTGGQARGSYGGGGGGLSLPRGAPQTRRSNNPYGDLSDIIRRSGHGGGGKGSGALGKMIRDVVGSLTGFRNTGVMSWIIRLIVVRYGWRILKFFLGRVLGR
ncbi:MAG: DUF937 domain-containing protein [Pseudomonadota bacterium]